MSAFVLVSAVAAAIGALMPGWRGALLVPAALYGTALVGRLIGTASGDVVNPAIIQAMIVEALSLALMAGSWWVLSRPAAHPGPIGRAGPSKGGCATACHFGSTLGLGRPVRAPNR